MSRQYCSGGHQAGTLSEELNNRLMQDPPAMKLLDGEVLPGDSLIVDANLRKEEMRFDWATVKTAP